ncbi:Alpha/Beta hydrolase protein [Biscogniauxia marginata]|nr:Alpha/Beta hydrolase protein [Biscogniauxia marginata]
MSSVWSCQPGVAFYTVYFTYRQSLSRTLFVYFGKYVATVELKPPLSLKSGKEKDHFVVIRPAETHVYRDILLCDPTIKPVNISAVWFPKPITHSNQHQRGHRVFLHLHGGAYLIGSGRDLDMGFATSLLLQSSPGSAIFCPEYRLSSLPGGRFPAAFQDAVTAYSYLITQLQIPASDIILSGDSAGAHLALALLRYTNAHQDTLPEPAALLLWIADDTPATKVDHVDTKVARSDPYLSPSKEAIPTQIPIWVQWGSTEVLREDIVKEGSLGTNEVPYALHDILALAPLLGWKSEAAKVVEEAIRFLNSKVA